MRAGLRLAFQFAQEVVHLGLLRHRPFRRRLARRRPFRLVDRQHRPPGLLRLAGRGLVRGGGRGRHGGGLRFLGRRGEAGFEARGRRPGNRRFFLRNQQDQAVQQQGKRKRPLQRALFAAGVLSELTLQLGDLKAQGALRAGCFLNGHRPDSNLPYSARSTAMLTRGRKKALRRTIGGTHGIKAPSRIKGARLPWHYLKPFFPVIGGCFRGPQSEERSATGDFSVVV